MTPSYYTIIKMVMEFFTKIPARAHHVERFKTFLEWMKHDEAYHAEKKTYFFPLATFPEPAQSLMEHAGAPVEREGMLREG